MQMQRLKGECPPDAHKVFREPEQKLKAKLCVKVTDQEIETFSAADVCQTLELMSEKALILCSERAKAALIKAAAGSEFKPEFLSVSGNEAHLSYQDGAVGPSLPFYPMADDVKALEQFIARLSEECFISVDTKSMLILRSISTVYPWDKFLAEHFMRQYFAARALLDPENEKLFMQIRYGLKDPLSVQESNAYHFLRLERKLFLQYPTED